MQDYFPHLRQVVNSTGLIGLVWPRRVRSDQRKSLLRLIATSIEERIPPADLISQWSIDERGVQRRRLRRLAALLGSGVALADAVEQVPGVLSDEDVLTIRLGSQAGILAPTIRQALEDPELLSIRTRDALRGATVYFGFMVFAVTVICTFIQFRIAPVLQRIYADFDVDSRSYLVSPQGPGLFAAQFSWLIIGLLLIAAWLLFSTRGGRFLRRTIVDKYFGPMREWRAAEVLQRLGWVTASGRPLPSALSTLARYHFDPAIRHKLLFARNEVEQGVDLWQSLTTVKLLTPKEAHVMDVATRVGNRSWALKQLARAKQLRVNRMLEQASNLLLPALVIGMGALVLWQALSVFSVLTVIIDSLE